MSNNDTITDIIDGELDDELNLMKDSSLCFEEVRFQTFKNWPFVMKDDDDENNVKCTAEAMAQAGFMHVPTEESQDTARCFFCCKELDGWEPHDDPWEEHISHARGKCQFLKYAQDYETKATTKKFIELEIQRQKNVEKMLHERKIQRFKEQAEVVAEKMANLV